MEISIRFKMNAKTTELAIILLKNNANLLNNYENEQNLIISLLCLQIATKMEEQLVYNYCLI